MIHPAFFGYGSLVNRATHDHDPAAPAELTGWRRVWRHTSARPVAYLSVEPAEGVTIAGLVAAVPGDDWAALDAREHAYDRVDLPAATLTAEAGWARSVSLYAVREAGLPSTRHPVLLSYVDVVVQGFLQEFGASGAAAFFDTTAGWDAPILDDRAEPRYPRHRRLTGSERDMVDEGLARVGAGVIRS